MENTNVMVKLEENAEYGVVVTTAKSLNIPYVGVKKPLLIQKVNEKIDQINNGEVELVQEETQEPEINNAEEQNEVSNNKEDGTPKTEAPKAPKTEKAPRTPRAKGQKWYETTTPLYNQGDIVDIIAGPCLVGRQAEITRPSSKKDAMKCKLINPKDGTLQGTEITMDYYKIKLAEAKNPVVEDVAPTVTNEEEVANEVV